MFKMLKKLLRNKKANYADVVEYIGVALMIGFVLVFAILIYNGFDDGIQAMSNETMPQIVKDVSADSRANIPPLWDGLFIFILMSFMLFSVVSARFIPSSPRFVIISIFALIMLPFVAMFFENIWYAFAQNAKVSSVLADLTFVPFIMDHLVVVVLLYSAFIAIALLTKEDVIG